MTDDTRHAVAKPSFLKTLPRKLERPMLLLSFVWFLVIITELVNGTSPLLLSLGTVLWALFVLAAWTDVVQECAAEVRGVSCDG